MIFFPPSVLRIEQSRFGWAVSSEICWQRQPASSGRKEYADESRVDDRGIAEADVHRRRALDAFERAIERLEAELPRLLGPRLHVRLVDLDDVRAGGEQIADLGIERDRVIHGRQLAAAAVVVDLRLLRHRERPGHGHLHRLRRVPAQEIEVAHADRVTAADRADDPRHRRRMAAAVERRARIVEIDAFERRREQVRIAFAADFAVGDDVEAGLLLRADRDDRRVVLRLDQERLGNAPQFLRPDARRKTAGRASRDRSANPAAACCRRASWGRGRGLVSGMPITLPPGVPRHPWRRPAMTGPAPAPRGSRPRAD